MNNVSLIDGHIDGFKNGVYCKDCKYVMFSDFYGECSKAYRGIVNPYDYCEHGERRENNE